MISFLHYWILFALPFVAIAVYIWFKRFRKRPAIVVSSVRPFAKVSKAKGRLDFCDWCILIALLLLIVAIARPRWGNEKSILRAKGIDIIIAMDLSGSMKSIDLPPEIGNANDFYRAYRKGNLPDRLAGAKIAIRNFVESRPNDRIGLIGFADHAYSFAPPTLDHQWLLERLGMLEAGSIGDRTGIASPISSGISRLKNSDSPRRVLVLVTDGANTVQEKISPEKAAELAKEFNVIIHTVGVGGNRAVYVDPLTGQIGLVGNGFDEKLLKTIASTASGCYYHANDADAMKIVMDEINQLEKTTLETPKYMEYREFGIWFAAGALLFLLLGSIATAGWRLRLP